MSQRKALINGRWEWFVEGPAYGGSIRFGGALVVGASGTVGMRRDRKRNHAARERDELARRDAEVAT
jgi:hypothetical protein